MGGWDALLSAAGMAGSRGRVLRSISDVCSGSEQSGAASVHTFAMLGLIQPLHLSGRD